MQPVTTKSEQAVHQGETQELPDREIEAVKNILLEGFAQAEPSLPLMLVVERSETTGETVLRQRHLLPVSVISNGKHQEPNDDDGADIDSPNTSRQMNIPKEIVGTVAAYFGQEVNNLFADDRMQQAIRARHIAMYLVHEITGLNYTSIGHLFGGKDHTTVSHAVKKIQAEVDDPDQQKSRDELQDLKAEINSVARIAKVGKCLVVLSSEGMVSLPWTNLDHKPKVLGVNVEVALDWLKAEESNELYRRFGNTAFKLLRSIPAH